MQVEVSAEPKYSGIGMTESVVSVVEGQASLWQAVWICALV